MLSSAGDAICGQLARRLGSNQALQTQTMANQDEELAGRANACFKR